MVTCDAQDNCDCCWLQLLQICACFYKKHSQIKSNTSLSQNKVLYCILLGPQSAVTASEQYDKKHHRIQGYIC